MNWHRIRAIVRKDVRAITASTMVLLPMIIVPLLLCIIVPTALTVFALAFREQAARELAQIAGIMEFYPIPAVLSEPTHRFLYVFLNYSFIPLFMLVPVMVASVVAANSVVGEKERHTLETVLYTPITNREFLVGKLLSAFIPAVLIGFSTFVAFFVATNLVSYLMEGFLVVRALIWIPSLLLLMPSVSLLGLAVALLVSVRAKSFMEAQQIAGVVVLPFVVLVAVQVAGLVVFNTLYVVLFSVVLLAIGYFIISRAGPKFTRERLREDRSEATDW